MCKNKLWFIALIFVNTILFSQNSLKIEPPFWWEGMNYDTLEILIYGENIRHLKADINSPGIEITKTVTVENPNYLFVDLKIDSDAKKGFNLILSDGEEQVYKLFYELKERREGSSQRVGFNSSDVIYLLMPDRFANGDPANDTIQGMLEKPYRELSLGRHGGDLKGIQDNLDYIADMGFTAIWPNPVFENDMHQQSYHGYAISDFYKIDARLGTNKEFMQLVESCHARGIKVIKDMIFNHAGTKNYLIEDLPMKDWVHNWPELTRSNYRGEVATDPYASDYDKIKMNNGWFDSTMADLNQQNIHVLKYLAQNSIWWVENANLDGIRMDTYPYPDKDAMAVWAEALYAEYPNFSVVGESWLSEVSHVSRWQKNTSINGYNSNINSVFDFPLYFALNDALTEPEGWNEGFAKIYSVLSQDFLYSQPNDLVTFLDNHDVARFADIIDSDINKYKTAVVFYSTVRGAPQIYYGSEILMNGQPYIDHGSWRKDFPGGWQGDNVNAFTGEGLTDIQKEAQYFMKKMLNWRKTKDVIHHGSFKHFIPQDGVYVYTRYNEDEAVLVILNKNESEYSLNLERYREVLQNENTAFEVITGQEINFADELLLKPLQAMVLELKY
ncbi:MAG: glycoside hydrolase family 13 protein [Bacteroidales bacterium]|nr:glycoside hydrolase family 13 protein [Bacteroidales bacterium]MBN2818014.1 glycoside hydrolase family 13 protein [Bacteroidales bacterium]